MNYSNNYSKCNPMFAVYVLYQRFIPLFHHVWLVRSVEVVEVADLKAESQIASKLDDKTVATTVQVYQVTKQNVFTSLPSPPKKGIHP